MIQRSLDNMKNIYLTAAISSLTFLAIPAFCQTNAANIIDSTAMPQLFAPGILSTPYSEWSTSFTPDGQTVYSAQGGAYWTIIFSQKVKGQWTKPRVAAFSGRYNDTDPFVAPDGNRLFFVSNRPLPGMPPDIPLKQASLWYVNRLSPDSWGAPQHLDSAINLAGVANYAPSVSSKGTLFYCSRRKELKGMQSFYTRWQDDHYGMPQQLIIKGAAEIQDPFIAPDESYLVFLNGKDLFISFKNNGEWSEAQNLGPAVNNGDNNSSPHVSGDGKTLYYSSGRVKGLYKRDLSKPALNYDQLVRENSGPFNSDSNILMIPIHLDQRRQSAD